MILKNDQLSVTIRESGAEITSIVLNEPGLEFIWDGKPLWPKHSPLLFPIVGSVRNDKYLHKGKEYSLPRHGFAREKSFKVEKSTGDQVVFLLESNETTLAVYPFEFQFRVIYTLKDSSLSVAYQVQNTGNENMYFSVGAHPAFNIPLEKGLEFTDYTLHFNQKEHSDRWPITPEGQISSTPERFFTGEDKLDLKKELFYQEAIVFKDIKSDKISIRSDKSAHGLDFEFPGFPFLGIWSAKDADFVCIEPWCGIADAENAGGEIAEKEGIEKLKAGETFLRSWTITLY